MRPRIQAAWLMLLSSALAWSTPSPGAEGEALAILKDRGLAKQGRTFVIGAEKAVLDRIKEVRGSLAGYANLLGRKAAIDQAAAQLAHLEGRRAELQENLADLNQQIIEQAGGGQGGPMGRGGQNNLAGPMIARRDQVKLALAEVRMGQQTLRAEAPQIPERSAMEADVKAKGEAVKATLAELRPMIDSVIKTYADLGAETSVKGAIAELERAGKATLKLGPSEAFLGAVKVVDGAEQRLFGKKASTVSRKKARARK